MEHRTWCRTSSGLFLAMILALFPLPALALTSAPSPSPDQAIPAFTIATGQLASGKCGVAYFQQLAVSGGKGPYTWSMEKGYRLPMGLRINPSAGTIAGYPIREGSSTMTVRVTDSLGNTATRSYSLDVLLQPGELLSWNPGASSAPIDEMDGVIAAAEGNAHFAALRYDGTVWTWGDNSGNQLGRAGLASAKAPIPGIDNAVAIATGKEHTTILTADGSIREFGNYWGTPRSFAGTGIVALSGGDYYTVALKDDGTVWTWLYDQTPRQVTGFPKIVAIAAGRSYLDGRPDLALAEDGTVWTWTFKAPSPAKLSSPTDVIAIANTNGTFFLRADGTVYGTTLNGAIAVSETGTIHNDGSVWYHPDHGQPTRVDGLAGATAITSRTAVIPYSVPTLLPAMRPVAANDPAYSQAIARTQLQ